MGERKPPAASRYLPAGSASGARIDVLPREARCVLRFRPEHIEAMERALTMELPRKVGGSRGTDLRVCRLGPDEWWVTGPSDLATTFSGLLAKVGSDLPHSLIDITHRECDVVVAGEGAFDILGGGCPLDLERMSIGDVTRSLFGSAEVVILREERDRFRLAVARSYLPYVHGLCLKIVGELEAIALGLQPASAHPRTSRR